MAFNILYMLKKGKIDYLNDLNGIDLLAVTESVRKSIWKKEIVKACEKDFDNHPSFWLNIIYDMDNYFLLALTIKEKLKITFSIEQYKNILYNIKDGEKYILKNFKEIYQINENFIFILLQYVLEKAKNKDFWLDFLLKNDDFRVRALAMIRIINTYPDLLKFYEPDLTLYFTNKIGSAGTQTSIFLEKMNSRDVSLIAYNLFINGQMDLFRKVKEFLFQNYEENYLAYYLFEDCNMPFKEKNKQEIKKDLERYFLKDAKLRFTIYRNYTNSLRQEILEDFRKRLRILDKVDTECLSRFQEAYFYELGRKLEYYIEKYLDLSRAKTVEKIGEGSTCYALRLGEFVLKLCDTKWSYEDIICPNLFLIIKNLEEDYVRNQRGRVLFGLEVQPYLDRSVDGVDSKYLNYFVDTLKQLGFFLNDRLVSSKWGDNVRLLDSYKNADTANVEDLPEWFKEFPIVLVDRDRVYPVDRIIETPYGRSLRIKQLYNGY